MVRLRKTAPVVSRYMGWLWESRMGRARPKSSTLACTGVAMKWGHIELSNHIPRFTLKPGMGQAEQG